MTSRQSRRKKILKSPSGSNVGAGRKMMNAFHRTISQTSLYTSSTHSTASTSTGSLSSQSRKVRFDRATVIGIGTLDSYTDKEIGACWYNEDEWVSMDDSVDELVQAMTLNCDDNSEDDYFCGSSTSSSSFSSSGSKKKKKEQSQKKVDNRIVDENDRLSSYNTRGLEGLLPDRLEIREAQIEHGREAVLREQSNQRDRRKKNPEAIARVYRDSIKPFNLVRVAHLRARVDEKHAFNIYMSEEDNRFPFSPITKRRGGRQSPSYDIEARTYDKKRRERENYFKDPSYSRTPSSESNLSDSSYIRRRRRSSPTRAERRNHAVSRSKCVVEAVADSWRPKQRHSLLQMEPMSPTKRAVVWIR